MIIYRTAKRNYDQSHNGFIYHISKSEAKKAHNETAIEQIGDKIEIFDIALNKLDVINFLNNWCSYPDNG